MTTDELNAIVQAVMTELEKAGVDFDFKAETPQADDLVYVMRGTADKYQGITVKWQNLLDIIVQKATEAKNEAVSAKDIALQTLATIQGIESNVSSMKSSVETSEANVTQMKSDVSTMKASVEGTKTEVEGLKSDVTALKSQTQTIVDNAKEEVTGLLDTKVNYTDSLSYEEIMATNPVPDLTNKVASASALQQIGGRILVGRSKFPVATSTGSQEIDITFDSPLPNTPKAVFLTWWDSYQTAEYCSGLNVSPNSENIYGFKANTNRLNANENWYFIWMVIY